MTGKQAFHFYDRKRGTSVRLILKNYPANMTKEERLHYYLSLEPQDMFAVMESKIALPQTAKLFDSYVCECCGEVTAANWIRIQDGKKLCLDCAAQYDRFHV